MVGSRPYFSLAGYDLGILILGILIIAQRFCILPQFLTRFCARWQLCPKSGNFWLKWNFGSVIMAPKAESSDYTQ